MHRKKLPQSNMAQLYLQLVSAASKDLKITTAQIRNIVSAAVDNQIKNMQPYGTPADIRM